MQLDWPPALGSPENVPASLAAVSQLCRNCPYTCSSIIWYDGFPLSSQPLSQNERAGLSCSRERRWWHSPCVTPWFCLQHWRLGHEEVGWGTSLECVGHRYRTWKPKGPKAVVQENSCSSVCGAEQKGCSDLPPSSRHLCLAGTKTQKSLP